jgi:hypothetical protein
VAWNTKKKAALPAMLHPVTEPLDDYVLVLESDKPCNKHIDLEDPDNWKVDSYQKHYEFGFHKLAITTIDALYEDIAELSNNEYCFLVHGAPTDHVLDNPAYKHRRLTIPREDQEATLKSHKTKIALFDIDTLIIPDLTLDATGAERVRELLVRDGKLKEIDDTKMLYEWTSKAGWKPNSVRIRLMGIFEEEATLEAIKAWAGASGMVDVKIYDAQQPVYIAHPTFINGKPPIPSAERIGMLEGQFDEIAAIPEAGESETKEIPAQAENEDLVLARLYETGSVKKKISPGKFDITCPWVHEHTSQTDDGCVLMLPNYSGYSQHAFKCQHEHCKDKGVADLMAALEIGSNDEIEPIESAEDDNGSINALVRRYALLKDQDKLYDFVTGALLKIEAVNHAYAHIHRRPQAGTALLQHPNLVRADSMIYVPGRPRVMEWKGAQVINLWKEQVTIIPEEGDCTPWLKHVKWLVPNKPDREHMLNWLAFMIQHQDKKINHALLISGTPRIGKDTLLEPVKKYLGTYNVNEPSAEELKEQFTDYLHHTKLVVFQECQNFDKLNVENKLKPMLAAPPDTLRVRLFGAGFYKTPNLVQVVFMSNHRNALKISKGDGRYFTIWCDARPKPEKYYVDLYHFLEREKGYEIVVQWLLDRDVTEFNPAMLPPTNEYKDMITDMSGTDLEILIKERLVNREPPFHKDILKVSDLFAAGGWEGVTMKRFTTALDSLGCVPKKVRESYDKRMTHSLWAIHDTEKWAKAMPKEWLDGFLGEYKGGNKKKP